MSLKKRKSYLLVMALGGVALIVDRTVLTEVGGAPETALASSTIPNGTVEAPSVDGPSSTMAIPELPFPKLPVTSDQNGVTRDLFEPIRHAPSQTRQARSQDPDSSPGKRRDDLDTFRSVHRLDGLLLHQGLRIAVVNGKWVRINDELDGCSLVSILRDRAVFKCRDGQAELTIMPVSPRQAPG